MTNFETIQKDGQILVEDTLKRSFFAKKKMCEREAMTDIPAVMLLVAESNETNPDHDVCLEYQKEVGLTKPYHVAMVPLLHKEDVVDSIEDVVRAMPIMKFDFIVIAVEGYAKGSGNQNPNEYQRGSMEEEFRSDPFTDVREAIIVTAIDWDASQLFSTLSTYTYDDHGVPQFAEPESFVQELSEGAELGRIADTLQTICKYMSIALRTAEFHELLTQARTEKEGGE